MKHWKWVLFALFITLSALAACTPSEGQRCNPLQFSSDCERGFSCVYPANCAVAYCCPNDGGSTNANCQTCAATDGGTAD